MKNRELSSRISVVAVCGALVALGVAWHARRGSNALQTELESVEQERIALAANVSEKGQRLSAVQSARHVQASALRELKGGNDVSQKLKPASIRVERGPTIDERLQKEPDTQLYWLASRRSEVAANHRAFFRLTGLTPDQIERFENAVVRHDEQVMDVSAIIREQGQTKPDNSTAMLLAKAESDLNAAQLEILGDSGFHQLTDYKRTSQVRELVNGIAGGAVVVAREPLSAQQAEQLLQVMANASASYQRGGAAATSDIDWDLVDAQARAFLSPAQFEFFSTTEPPLPTGARFQSQLYRKVDEAKKMDAAKTSGQ